MSIWVLVVYAAGPKVSAAFGSTSTCRLRSLSGPNGRLPSRSCRRSRPSRTGPQAFITSPIHYTFPDQGGIPYSETSSQREVRKLWEGKPFTTARRIVDAVIQGDGADVISRKSHSRTTCLLRAITADMAITSGYEDLFEPLYGTSHHHPLLSSTSDDVSTDRDEGHLRNSYRGDMTSKLNHFCLTIAYRGDDFCGWQTQSHNEGKPSIQQSLEDWLTLLHQQDDDGKGGKEKRSVQRANLRVAGRTDSGVHAIGQISRFRSRRQGLTADNIQQHLSNLPRHLQTSIRVTNVAQVSKSFHPTFATTCRAYVYVVDTTSSAPSSSPGICTDSPANPDCEFWSGVGPSNNRVMEKVAYLNTILQHLEGKEIDFIGLSYGPLKTQTTNCTIHHARARLVQLPHDNDVGTNNQKRLAVCIELVADRFLRRMVRLLVASAMRLVVDRFTDFDGSDQSSFPPDTGGPHDDDALLRHILLQDRRLGGPAAPPDGLIFVGARLTTG